VRTRPTIPVCSHDVLRQGGSSGPGVAIGLGAIVLFGAAVYAATGPEGLGALLAIVVVAALVVLSRARFIWFRWPHRLTSRAGPVVSASCFAPRIPSITGYRASNRRNCDAAAAWRSLPLSERLDLFPGHLECGGVRGLGFTDTAVASAGALRCPQPRSTELMGSSSDLTTPLRRCGDELLETIF
jgi:hypothetical protein